MKKAKKRPAVVELPVMPGDPVWVLVRNTGEIYRHTVDSIILSQQPQRTLIVTTYVSPIGYRVYPRRRISQLGRTLFTSREAAEAARDAAE